MDNRRVGNSINVNGRRRRDDENSGCSLRRGRRNPRRCTRSSGTRSTITTRNQATTTALAAVAAEEARASTLTSITATNDDSNGGGTNSTSTTIKTEQEQHPCPVAAAATARAGVVTDHPQQVLLNLQHQQEKEKLDLQLEKRLLEIRQEKLNLKHRQQVENLQLQLQVQQQNQPQPQLVNVSQREVIIIDDDEEEVVVDDEEQNGFGIGDRRSNQNATSTTTGNVQRHTSSHQINSGRTHCQTAAVTGTSANNDNRTGNSNRNWLEEVYEKINDTTQGSGGYFTLGTVSARVSVSGLHPSEDMKVKSSNVQKDMNDLVGKVNQSYMQDARVGSDPYNQNLRWLQQCLKKWKNDEVYRAVVPGTFRACDKTYICILEIIGLILSDGTLQMYKMEPKTKKWFKKEKCNFVNIKERPGPLKSQVVAKQLMLDLIRFDLLITFE